MILKHKTEKLYKIYNKKILRYRDNQINKIK